MSLTAVFDDFIAENRVAQFAFYLPVRWTPNPRLRPVLYLRRVSLESACQGVAMRSTYVSVEFRTCQMGTHQVEWVAVDYLACIPILLKLSTLVGCVLSDPQIRYSIG